MNRPNWGALIQAAIGLIFLSVGFTRLLPAFAPFPMTQWREHGFDGFNGMQDFSGMMGFSFLFIIFWLIIALALTISGIVRFFRGSSRHRSEARYERYYDRRERPGEPTSGTPGRYTGVDAAGSTGPAARLRELDQMRQDGLISLEEYDQKKKEILEHL